MRKFVATTASLAMAASVSVAIPAPAAANGGSAEACKFITGVFDELKMGDCMQSSRGGTGGGSGGAGGGAGDNPNEVCKSYKANGTLDEVDAKNLGQCVSDGNGPDKG